MNFSTFHLAYRHYRAQGLGKIDALKKTKEAHPDLNRAYCKAQEQGEAWTREPLDAKDPVRMQTIISTGKLI